MSSTGSAFGDDCWAGTSEVDVSTGIGVSGCCSCERYAGRISPGTMEIDVGDWPANGTSSPALGTCPGKMNSFG